MCENLEPHPQCSIRFSDHLLSTKLILHPLLLLFSIDKCLEIYEKELNFQLAAALHPRWKLAWCTQEVKP